MASVQTLPTANFANLNLPTFKVPSFGVATPTPVLPVVSAPAPVLPVVTPVSAPALASALPVVTPVMPVVTPVSAPTAGPPVAPVAFQLQLDSIDQKLSKQSTQEQQHALAGFVFKVPRVRSALVEATVDKNLQRTIDNIEHEREKKGQGVVPLDRFSSEDQAVIALARKEYDELLNSRHTDGKVQFEKDLKAWNEMKVLDVDGKETGQLAQSYVKILRDVFTLEFKHPDHLAAVLGVIDSKVPSKNSGVRAWIKSHKEGTDRLSIRSRCQDPTHLVVEFTYNSANPVSSDALIQEFNVWLSSNATTAVTSYHRVTAEYKKKMVKDKKTQKFTEQEKKKPTTPIADPLAGKDVYTAALYMVNRLRNRFSDDVSIAMTILINYLVQQFSYIAILKCREENKARVMVRHVLENTSQIELFPLVSNFHSYREYVLKAANSKPLNGTVIGPHVTEDTESTKKHEFEYCVSGVCKQLCSDLIEEDKRLGVNRGYDKILISSEFKHFMCKLVDELIASFGPILRKAIESNDVKTVNVNTFYSVLSVLLGWHRIKYESDDGQGIRPYIEERVKRYVGYEDANQGEAVHHDGYIEVRAKERATVRKQGKNPGASE